MLRARPWTCILQKHYACHTLALPRLDCAVSQRAGGMAVVHNIDHYRGAVRASSMVYATFQGSFRNLMHRGLHPLIHKESIR